MYGELGNIGGLAIAALLFYAGLYPAPPWRNEPLKLLITYVAFVTCFVGLLVGSYWAMARAVEACFGSEVLESTPVTLVLYLLSMAVPICVGGLFEELSQKLRSGAGSPDGGKEGGS
jgi:hypothetical protein